MWQELIKKIEFQSILVLFITLSIGTLLLKMDNSFVSPAGILGTISISFGLLYTFGSFFSNQIRESYKDVISEYKSTISTLRSSHKEIEQSYKKTLSSYGPDKQIGEYRPIDTIESTTESE